jgi:YggT family protein
MYEALAVLTALDAGLRSVLLAGGVAVALVATADWAARTRRINPFGGVARFLRGQVDPRLAGIERQVMRAGGHPSATPWWGLVAYVIVAAVLIAALDVLSSSVREAFAASTLGARGIFALLVHWTFRFLSFALLVRVIASWFPRLAHTAWARWAFVATEWMIVPLRRIIPTFGMLDITPIVAYFTLQFAEWVVGAVLFRGL